MYQVGSAKSDITAFVKGVGMLGYGIHYNTMESIETPLSARAFIFYDKSTDRKICYVNCEIAFVTIAIKKGVLKTIERKHPEYRYDEDNLMITAQHTHSGPSGFSYYGLYNLSTPGFVMEIYKKIVDGIVEAIIKAEGNLRNAKLSINTGTFELDKEVAYQRSIDAYNLNPEVKTKISFKDRHLALDREMTLLKIEGEKGENIGVFAQGTCGDVTPRVIYNPIYPFQRGQWEGKFPNDLESTKYNGRLQYEKAKEIIEAEGETNISGPIDFELLFVNFTDVHVDPKFANGKTDARTGDAALGLAFFTGTRIDGPGMHPFIAFFVKTAIRIIKRVEKFRSKFASEHYKKVIERKYRTQGNKDILIESNARRILGTTKLDRIIVPAALDPAIATIKYFYKKVGHVKKPWTPRILPLQLFIIGDVAFAGFPFEITTIAGQRLRNSLLETLSPIGIKRVILNPYANGYSGYITTYEEYQGQVYEGGHTVFGEWSLAALQTKFDVLAKQFLKPKKERVMPHDAIPPDFTEEELNQFPFYKRAWYIRQELIRARRMERKGVHYDPFE